LGQLMEMSGGSGRALWDACSFGMRLSLTASSGSAKDWRDGPGNEVRLVCILMADQWGALSQNKSLAGIGF
jgi:hypothetical protein